MSGVITYSASLGGFRHSFYGEPQRLSQLELTFTIMGALGVFVFGSWKVSVGCLILRLLLPASRWYRRIIWFLILSTILNTCLNMIVKFVECNPPKGLWQPFVPHTCWDQNVSLEISYAGIS